MLVPSGKNLLRWSDMTAFDGKIRTIVTPDGGMHVVAKAGLGLWCGVLWNLECATLGLSPGDTITASLPAGETLGGGLLFNLKFLRADGKYTVQQSFGWGNVETLAIPDSTTIIQFSVMVWRGGIPADMSKTVHPQLEHGSARTCWEPPAILAVGGQPKRP